MQSRLVRPSSPVVILCLAMIAPAIAQEGEQGTKVVSSAELNDLFAKPAATREQVEAWRKKFAFQSLSPRLDYERTVREAAAPRLGDVAESQLKLADEHGEGAYWKTRADSLEMLHTLEVDEFISRSGFGISRRPMPGAQYVEPGVIEPIDFVKLPPSSNEETDRTATAYLNGDRDAPAAAANYLRWMPTRDEIAQFHAQGTATFATPWDFGLIKGVDRVAGFQPHRFSYLPHSPLDAAHRPQPQPQGSLPAPDENRWKVTRVELVSLLKHDGPRVYVSDHLPQMEELSSATAETRELTAFETQSLAKLHDGEEVQTRSTPNRIEMLGAVRAGKACRQCHEVPRGTMLCAFSYELRRDPPIQVATETPTVQ